MQKNRSPQYQVTKQTIQTRHIRFELLNNQFQIIGELNGVATDGNISIDSTSDVRRSGSIQMIIQKSSINLGIGSPFWLDKYIRVFVGIEKLGTEEIVWNNCGIFIVDAPTYEYNATNNTISLSLLDLMAKLTGTRNGYVEYSPVILKANESIRQAFIETLKMAGFNKYIIENPPKPGLIPNDLEFGQGTTFYNILSGLRDIYPNYEIFFDVNGTFIYRKIPTGDNDPVVIDDDIWKNIVISENSNVNLNEVKNAIEVFGRIHEPEHIAVGNNVQIIDNAGSLESVYLTIPSLIKYTEDMIYGFEIPKETNTFYLWSLKINNLNLYTIEHDNNTAGAWIYKSNKNEIYCIQFKGDHWRWLGHLQAHGYAENQNPESPYYVNGPVGRIYLPLFDGQYANCITDNLAQQRAKYELYLHSNLKDNLTLQCVPVYWFDVNMLVSYTSGRTNKTNKYLIKNINLGLNVNSTMNITMMRFYPTA